MADEPLPRLDPVEAIAFFRAKGWEIGFDWRDVWQEEHGRAFTVAKAMSRDLLEDIRAEVDKALSEGTTLAQFTKALRPKLAARGWWGKALQEDPLTGETRVVQLGSPARLRTIYETNLRTSYMAGKWQRIQRAKRTLPFLRYVSVMDGRERDEHHAWHGTVLPVDHPWWDTHYPPCGWGCRCEPQPLNQRMLDRRGWEINEPQRFPEKDYVNRRTGEVTRLERGIDPGWSYNVGKAPLDGLTPAPRTARGGEDGELQASLSEASYAPLRRFFQVFGLADQASAVSGRIWTDPAGWPLAISAGLFRGADGNVVRLSTRDAEDLNVAAWALFAPDTIGWVWVTGKDGRAMLVRRYRSALGVVDMGGSFWRWHAGDPGRFAPGLVVWQDGESALQGYNPRQPRDNAGRWSDAHGYSYTELSSELTAGELDAIYAYTGDHYEAMNTGLRDEDWLDPDTERFVADLDSAIAKGTLTGDTTLFRGIHGDGARALAAQGLSEGSIFRDAGFTSSTKDFVIADRFSHDDSGPGMFFVIKARRGNTALDVTREASLGTGEREVVFPRNQAWRIRKIDDTNGTVEIEPAD